MHELETIPTAEPAERVAGDDDRSARRPVRRRVIAAGCVVVALAACVSWAWTARDRSPSPGERLRAIQEFVQRATSVRFEASHELTSPFAGPAPTYRTEGALLFPASAWRVSHGGASPDEESIRIPEGRYVRVARPGRPLWEMRWEFIPNAHTSRSWGIGGAAGRPDLGELLAGLGPPLDAEPDRADLREVVAALADPVPAGDGTIRARLPLTKLFREPRLAEAMLDGTGVVELRLSSGPNGRLDRLEWELDARPLDAPPGARCNIPPAPSGYGPAVCVRERADISFTEWNRLAEIDVPAFGSVDVTPGVDEEGLARMPEALALAPRTVPEGLVLRWGVFEGPSEENPGGCGVMSLTYVSTSQTRPGPGRYLSVTTRSGEQCSPNDLMAGPARPRSVVAGALRVEMFQEPGATAGVARLRVGQVPIRVEWTQIAEAEVLAALASLGPLDLATQPVYESIPPRY